MDSVYQVEKEEKKVYGDYASDVRGYFGFNVDCSDEQQIKIEEGISLAISKKWMDMDIAYSTECIADDRSYFFGTFSGLFALVSSWQRLYSGDDPDHVLQADHRRI